MLISLYEGALISVLPSVKEGFSSARGILLDRRRADWNVKCARVSHSRRSEGGADATGGNKNQQGPNSHMNINISTHLNTEGRRRTFLCGNEHSNFRCLNKALHIQASSCLHKVATGSTVSADRTRTWVSVIRRKTYHYSTGEKLPRAIFLSSYPLRLSVSFCLHNDSLQMKTTREVPPTCSQTRTACNGTSSSSMRRVVSTDDTSTAANITTSTHTTRWLDRLF